MNLIIEGYCYYIVLPMDTRDPGRTTPTSDQALTRLHHRYLERGEVVDTGLYRKLGVHLVEHRQCRVLVGCDEQRAAAAVGGGGRAGAGRLARRAAGRPATLVASGPREGQAPGRASRPPPAPLDWLSGLEGKCGDATACVCVRRPAPGKALKKPGGLV